MTIQRDTRETISPKAQRLLGHNCRRENVYGKRLVIAELGRANFIITQEADDAEATGSLLYKDCHSIVRCREVEAALAPAASLVRVVMAGPRCSNEWARRVNAQLQICTHASSSLWQLQKRPCTFPTAAISSSGLWMLWSAASPFAPCTRGLGTSAHERPASAPWTRRQSLLLPHAKEI